MTYDPNSEPRRSYTSFTGPTGVEDTKDYDPTAALERFDEKFGQFYVSIDSATKTIRIVDIENGIKVNSNDGTLIECVASGDIKTWLNAELLLAYKKGLTTRTEQAVAEERRRLRELVPTEKSRSQFLRQITHADIPLANIQARAMEIGWNTCRDVMLHALQDPRRGGGSV